MPGSILKNTSDLHEVGDLLSHAFLDTLRRVETVDKGDAVHERDARQLLYDFVRILFFSNTHELETSDMGQMQIKYLRTGDLVLIF